MKKVKTESGFFCQIDEKVLDDMQMIDDLAAIDGGNAVLFPRVVERLIGKSGKERLYDHLRTEDGRVPIEAFGRELGDIIRAIGETEKNS